MPRPRDPRLAHIFQAYIEKGARQINKAEPARVLSYNAETQQVDVQPLIQVDMSSGGRSEPEFETSAPLHEVPVLWPGGSNGFLHMSLEPGDNVLIVHCDQDISRWLVTGSISPPEIHNLHGSHPIAIPGLRHHSQTLSVSPGSHVTLAATDELRLGSDTATAFVALANLVLDRLQAIHTAVNTHVHVSAAPGSPTGPAVGPFTPPDPPPAGTVLSATPASVAAAKVKAR